jgi:YidC/Oxa1 family membrane protein insertase
MDKKNTLIGGLLLIAAVVVLYFAPRSAPPTKPTNVQPATAPGTPLPVAAPAGAAAAATPVAAPTGDFAPITREVPEEKPVILANDFIEVRFTGQGGAVRDVAFKKYPLIQGESAPYVFNHLHDDPILALGNWPKADRNARYELVSATATEVIYRTVIDGRIEVTRRYRLTTDSEPGGDPYRIRHETIFRNLSDETAMLPRPTLALGTATLLNEKDPGIYLNVSFYDGGRPVVTTASELAGGGFFSSLFGGGSPPVPQLEKSGQVVWAATKNQFFTSIYTPDKPGIGVVTRRIDLSKDAPFPDQRRPNVGLTGAARFEVPALAAKGTATLGGLLYVGPTEYQRLAKFLQNEDRVKQFDASAYSRLFLSRYVAPLENILLDLAHRWAGNWGVAVILMTLMLKIVSLPFTISASRSAKRMAKLQPQLQAMREKYKDNPQKQQMATMELFKEHKVNPLGGCIPILITFPLFIGFYAMLGTAAELRFQHFLWVQDLAAPDTVATIFGFPVNIMPLLMGATMLYQMRLTPQPSVDNTQAMMMKFMPIIFIIFCYGFSAALSLYSTINGLFTIGQQMVINKMRDDGDPATARPATNKPIKNVTPGKDNKRLK